MLLLALAERARTELADEGCAIGEVALGVMLEIPSAILVGDTYFGRIAFASLGTNDLAQYTLAVDRGNPALERYRDALHPAVLRLIAQAVDAAARAGIELSVCGEMAGDPAAALALVGLGLRSLSMAAPACPRFAERSGAAMRRRWRARPALLSTMHRRRPHAPGSTRCFRKVGHGMNAALRGRRSGGAWFSEAGFNEADERVDRRVLVRAVGDEADPVVLRDACGQQHEHRFGVDGALAAREVLDRDLRGEPGWPPR